MARALRPKNAWPISTPRRWRINFAINATGPALAGMKHFLPRHGAAKGTPCSQHCRRALAVFPITGWAGWYGYRASKAALNQIVRTASQSSWRARTPAAICVALHPGTVATGTFRAVRQNRSGRCKPRPRRRRNLLAVIDALVPAQSGTLLDQNERTIPF